MAALASAVHRAAPSRALFRRKPRQEAPRSSVRTDAGGFDAMMTSLRRLRAMRDDQSSSSAETSNQPSSASNLDGVRFEDEAPSWDELGAVADALKTTLGVPLAVDLENGPANPKALIRRFGTTVEPRVLFFRDHAAWCPYCEKIWMQLEEKRIPYRVEKINMRCYGDKKPSFTAKVPSGMLPVMEIDGRLVTESALIADALEREFPEHKPLLAPAGSALRKRQDDLNRLERALFGRWMQWLTSSWMDGQMRSGFEEALDAVEAELAFDRTGPYFCGPELTLIDITFTPFLERMAASLAYYKGFRMEGNGGRWPNLDAWYEAMANRTETYAHIKSDYYTHAHDLPPQLGGCEPNGDAEQVAYMNEIDGVSTGGDSGDSWKLPLKPLKDKTNVEPWWGPGEENAATDRLEAAVAIIGNRDAVVRFAARGCGAVGTRRVAASLSDPTAVPDEAHVPAVDAALRRVCAELLAEGGARPGVKIGSKFTSDEKGSLAGKETAASLAYLRDRVGVPRDMKYPAARQLRAHLNWFIDGLAA